VIAATVAGGYWYRWARTGGTRRSLAVLPFDNAGSPDQEYVTEGLTEGVINTVSQMADLRVMSRAAVYRFKGKSGDGQDVGRKLGVSAVLTGPLTQNGGTMALAVELLDVASGEHRWGRQVPISAAALREAQQEIA